MTNSAHTPHHTLQPQAYLGRGQVRHRRFAPKEHAFEYPCVFLYLPMRALAQGRASWKGIHHSSAASTWLRKLGICFSDSDHGLSIGKSSKHKEVAAPFSSLRWIEGILQDAGIKADGEIWLQTFPRMLGFAFKPVSFWYCHNRNGKLMAVFAEVHNTFGQKHGYLLNDVAWGATATASKSFHVSPFFATEGSYQFRFMQRWSSKNHSRSNNAPPRILATVKHNAPDGSALLHTSWSGELYPATRAQCQRALLLHPFHALGIVWRIHWQALWLWLKKIRFHSLPDAPTHTVTLQHKK